MYPCLTQVRRSVRTTVARLLRELPGVRIGVMAHIDYDADGRHEPYLIKTVDLTRDADTVCNFVETVAGGDGGGTAAKAATTRRWGSSDRGRFRDKALSCPRHPSAHPVGPLVLFVLPPTARARPLRVFDGVPRSQPVRPRSFLSRCLTRHARGTVTFTMECRRGGVL